MNQSHGSSQSEFLVIYAFSFLFNKPEKVDSFLFPLFNSVKKRVGKLYQQPKICTFRENLIFLSLSTDGKLSNSKPNTSVKLVIIDWPNVKKRYIFVVTICRGLLQFLTPKPKIF